MKKTLGLALSFLSFSGLFFSSCEKSAYEGDFNEETEIGREMLLMLSEEAASLWEEGDSAAVADIVRGEMEISSLRPALSAKPKNAKLAAELGLDRWFVVNFAEERDLSEVGNILVQSPCVELVQPNRYASVSPSGTVETFRPLTRSA